MTSYAIPKHSQPVSDAIRKGPEILRTTSDGFSVPENGDAFTTEYHCTTEWHLCRLASKYATPIYSFALRISYLSERFYCSQDHLAHYFACTRRTVWSAIQELEKTGFFIRISSSPFCTNVYTVLGHETWAEDNPGRCATKIEMPWSREGLELGRQLHAMSGGRVKFRPEQIRYLMVRYSEEKIKQAFRKLLETRSIPVDRHGFINTQYSGWEALCSGT
jgi:HTH domain